MFANKVFFPGQPVRFQGSPRVVAFATAEHVTFASGETVRVAQVDFAPCESEEGSERGGQLAVAPQRPLRKMGLRPRAPGFAREGEKKTCNLLAA